MLKARQWRRRSVAPSRVKGRRRLLVKRRLHVPKEAEEGLSLSSHGRGTWRRSVDPCTWMTLVGAGTNVFLGTLKVGVGAAWESPALLSDGAHSFSDLASDAVALVAYAEARRPPDENHTYGHGKLESAGALGVGAMLVAVAGVTALHASAALTDCFSAAVEVSAASSSSSSAAAETAEAVVRGDWSFRALVPASAALLSIAAKEWLFRATKRVGERAGSAAVVANAYHHRSDALSSVASFAGVALAKIAHPACDPAAGLLVAVMVGHAGLDISRRALDELVDAVDPTVVRALRNAVELPLGAKISSLKARTAGGALLVDADLVVKSVTGSTVTASAAHHVAEHAKQRLLQAANESLGLKVIDLTLQLVREDDDERDDESPGVLHGGEEKRQRRDQGPSQELLPPPQELECHIRGAIDAFDTHFHVARVTDVALVYHPTKRAVTAKVAVQFADDTMTLRDAAEVADDLRIHLRNATPYVRLDADVACALLLPPQKPPGNDEKDYQHGEEQGGKRGGGDRPPHLNLNK